jgi:hypothetical protein
LPKSNNTVGGSSASPRQSARYAYTNPRFSTLLLARW